jgi:hypothetical protein
MSDLLCFFRFLIPTYGLRLDTEDDGLPWPGAEDEEEERGLDNEAREDREE